MFSLIYRLFNLIYFGLVCFICLFLLICLFVCVCVFVFAESYGCDGFWHFAAVQFSSCWLGPQLRGAKKNGIPSQKRLLTGYYTKQLPHPSFTTGNTCSQSSSVVSVSLPSEPRCVVRHESLRHRTKTTTETS